MLSTTLHLAPACLAPSLYTANFAGANQVSHPPLRASPMLNFQLNFLHTLNRAGPGCVVILTGDFHFAVSRLGDGSGFRA